MIGNKYMYQGKEVTITHVDGDQVRYSGKGFGGRTSHTSNFFKLNFKKIPEPKVIPKKTRNASSAGNKRISATELAKVLQTGNTEEIKIARASSVGNILKIPKDKSKNFYTIIAVIALIIIFFEAKLFKKLVK